MKLKPNADGRTCEAVDCSSAWQVWLGQDSILGRAHGKDLCLCLPCMATAQKLVAGSSAVDSGGNGRAGSYIAPTPGQRKFAERPKKSDAFAEDEE